MEGIQYIKGIPSVHAGDNISSVEVIQYSVDKDLKYYEFSKNLEIFPELISLRNHIDHIAVLKC